MEPPPTHQSLARKRSSPAPQAHLGPARRRCSNRSFKTALACLLCILESVQRSGGTLCHADSDTRRVWQLPSTKNGALPFEMREVRCEDLLEVIAKGLEAGKEVRIFGLGGFTPATRQYEWSRIRKLERKRRSCRCGWSMSAWMSSGREAQLVEEDCGKAPTTSERNARGKKLLE